MRKKLNIQQAANMRAADPVIAGTKLSRMNIKRATSNTGVLGVSYHIRMGKYQARIVFQGKHYFLGTYDKLDDAAAARKIAENKLHGDFLEWYKSQNFKNESKK